MSALRTVREHRPELHTEDRTFRMQTNANSPTTEAFAHRDATNDAIAVVDGYGVAIKVHRGHLVVEDGIGMHRRERRYTRGSRQLRRLVVLGHTGIITLDAIRWCHDVGITITQIDTDGRVLTASSPKTHDDARLRRTQALAAGTETGLTITRYLLTVKLHGQAANAESRLDAPDVAAVIRAYADALGDADLAGCQALEAQAANAYFDAWFPAVTMTFARKDYDRVPDHWRGFLARTTPLINGKTPRNAADPINAMLNYSYALIEAEAITACHAVGLDPGLGLLHTDKKQRASLALDLVEAVRPDVERTMLDMLADRVFRAADFHETRDGRCRLLAPLTHQLGAMALRWHVIIGPHVEQVAHALAMASDAPIPSRTPLTQANVRAVVGESKRRIGRPTATPRLPKLCRECGVEIDNARTLCRACAPADLRQRGRTAMGTAVARLDELRAAGKDPTTAPEPVERRRQSQRRNRAAMLDWQRRNPGVRPDPSVFLREIRPLLTDMTIGELRRVTGLSESACSRVRSGKLIPHVRHWEALRAYARGAALRTGKAAPYEAEAATRG